MKMAKTSRNGQDSSTTELPFTPLISLMESRFSTNQINHNFHIFQGQPLALTPEQEEISSWWAQAIGSEFADKETVKRNFEQAFIELFDPVRHYS